MTASPPDNRAAIAIFFCSSTRRPTRFSRDWSSDVCSSELQLDSVSAGRHRAGARTSQEAGPATLIAPWDCRAPARQRFPPDNTDATASKVRAGARTSQEAEPATLINLPGIVEHQLDSISADNTEATASKVRAGARTSQGASAGIADRPPGIVEHQLDSVSAGQH